MQFAVPYMARTIVSSRNVNTAGVCSMHYYYSSQMWAGIDIEMILLAYSNDRSQKVFAGGFTRADTGRASHIYK